MKKAIILLFLLNIQPILAQQTDTNLKVLYHQFDFWLGHWDVYKFGTETLVGESRIETIIDSLGILENYTTLKGGYKGKSINKYNPAKKQWEQYWVDNSGLTLFLTGSYVNNKMILSDLVSGDTNKGFNKIVWERINENTVRQTWSISKDNGLTWSVVFDGEYRRRIN